MSTAEAFTPIRRERSPDDVPPLEPGDHLDRRTFHERYEAMPPGVKAELIGGVVYMPSPAKRRHGRGTGICNAWLALYESATPGVEFLDNTSAILADDSEPQPDVVLRILETHGGQSHEDEDGWIVGAPELVVEVASSSVAYDLHSKLRDYERHGVQEYVVVVVRDGRVRWFVRDGEQFVDMQPGEDGIFRSPLFGGLWLDPAALLRGDLAAIRKTVEQGLASPEHSETIARLKNASDATESGA